MTLSKKEKIFVLDTNVILHDSSCIFQFGKNDVVIPITVLEELDQFKKGNQIINFHARQFIRFLGEVSGDKTFNGGIKIGDGLGRITIKLGEEFDKKLKKNFSPSKEDHHILNTAFCVARENKEKQVIFITKDMNLRMKAKSIGLITSDYAVDQVENVDHIYKGHRTIEGFPPELIDEIFQEPYAINAEHLKIDNFFPNEFFILRNGKKSVITRFNHTDKTVERINRRECCGIIPKNAEQIFALNALVDNNIPLVTVSGKAGTGKTLLALAASLQVKRHYRQIFVARSTVPLGNKDEGYLPGDIYSKLDPYMQPIYDNLITISHDCNNNENGNGDGLVNHLIESNKLIVTPLSYIRGRSLVKIFFIIDEAQNLTPHEVRTIVTRAGENTKIVFTGDIFQIDHPFLDAKSNGLSYLIEKMKGHPLYAHINLEKGERSKLANAAIEILT